MSVHDGIVHKIENGQVCALVLLDLSFAFDRVDHDTAASFQSTVWSSIIDDGLVRLIPDQPDADLPARNESVWTTPSPAPCLKVGF